MVGKEGEEWRLRQVNLVFTYTAKGEKHEGTIVADEAVLTPTVEKGVFQGHVKLTTDDGAELATEQLIYRGDKKLAKSELADGVQAREPLRHVDRLRVPERGGTPRPAWRTSSCTSRQWGDRRSTSRALRRRSSAGRGRAPRSSWAACRSTRRPTA